MRVTNSPPDSRCLACASALELGAMCTSKSTHTLARSSQWYSSSINFLPSIAPRCTKNFQSWLPCIEGSSTATSMSFLYMLCNESQSLSISRACETVFCKITLGTRIVSGSRSGLATRRYAQYLDKLFAISGHHQETSRPQGTLVCSSPCHSLGRASSHRGWLQCAMQE